jgi:ParB family chromosome partitioning protein
MKGEQQYEASIFWVPIDKIIPNPYQPRREFDELRLKELADSIRQYGVLQPLVVTKKETEHGDGNITVEYELIAGERRLRASKLAGLSQLPVLIRSRDESDQMKLELAIIENLQREDLNPVDRARAFKQLADTFKFTHNEIGIKVGRSREYVSNTIRITLLPDNIQQSIIDGQLSEGHTRPLLMLTDRQAEQETLFAEILSKKLTVREAEQIARRIAVERARKKILNPEMLALERELTESLGTRVHIEEKDNGGKLIIDYFSPEDLQSILSVIKQKQEIQNITGVKITETKNDAAPEITEMVSASPEVVEVTDETVPRDEAVVMQNDAPPKEEEDLYSVRNFSL